MHVHRVRVIGRHQSSKHSEHNFLSLAEIDIVSHEKNYWEFSKSLFLAASTILLLMFENQRWVAFAKNKGRIYSYITSVLGKAANFLK